MGDLILLEFLQGIRSDHTCRTTREHLKALDQYEVVGAGQVDVCAGHYRAPRKRGITIRKTAGVVMDSVCITRNMPLLFRERDFQPSVDRLGPNAGLEVASSASWFGRTM